MTFNEVRKKWMFWLKLEIIIADCSCCGMEYIAASQHQLYCSKKCQRSAQNKRAHTKKKYTLLVKK